MTETKKLQEEIKTLKLLNEQLKTHKKDYFAFECPACGEVTRGILLFDTIFSSQVQPSFYCNSCKTEWCTLVYEHDPLKKFEEKK